MTKRKVLKSAAFAIAAFALITGACGGSDTATEESVTEETAAAAADPCEGSELKLGLAFDTGGRGDGRDKDQGANMAYSHEVINGVAYRIDNETGAVEALDGLDATIAKTLAGFVNNFTIGGILNRNETYQDKLDRIKDISEEAYNEITANVR